MGRFSCHLQQRTRSYRDNPVSGRIYVSQDHKIIEIPHNGIELQQITA